MIRLLGRLAFCLALVLSIGLPGAAYSANSDEERVLRLLQTAEKFRLVGIRDATRLNGFFAKPGATPFPADIVGEEPGYQQDVWGLFFRQAQIYVGNTLSAEPIVGFYSPIIDFWLLTVWRDDGAASQLATATIFPGEVLRQTARSNGGVELLPDWMRALKAHRADYPITVRDALQELTAYSVLAFVNRFPEEGQSATVLPPTRMNATFVKAIFANRLDAFFNEIVAFFADKAAGRTYEAVLQALEADNSDRIKALSGPAHPLPTADLIDKLPKDNLRALAPILVMEDVDGSYVLSASESNGRFALVIGIAAGKEADPAYLKTFSAIDLYAQVHGP